MVKTRTEERLIRFASPMEAVERKLHLQAPKIISLLEGEEMSQSVLQLHAPENAVGYIQGESKRTGNMGVFHEVYPVQYCVI